MSFNTIKVNNTDTNYTHSIFDISEYTGKTYDTLSDALTDVPDGKQKGGMTISFVLNSDNKYVQYKLISETFNIDVTNWQGVDKIPSPGSTNLVESGILGTRLERINKRIYTPTNTGGYISKSIGRVQPYENAVYSDFIPCEPGQIVKLSLMCDSSLGVCFYKSNSEESFIIGSGINHENIGIITVPQGAYFLRASSRTSYINPFVEFTQSKCLEDIPSVSTNKVWTPYAVNSDDSIDDPIVNVSDLSGTATTISRRQLYNSIRNIKLYGFDITKKHTLYVFWYNSEIFSFRISEYNESTSSWNVVFEYTPSGGIPSLPSNGYYCFDITKNNKRVVVSIKTDFAIGGYVFNPLTSSPEYIFDKCCYETDTDTVYTAGNCIIINNNEISVDADSLPVSGVVLEGEASFYNVDAEDFSMTGFINPSGIYNSSHPTFKCTDFLPCKAGQIYIAALAMNTNVIVGFYRSKNQSDFISGYTSYDTIHSITVPEGALWMRLTNGMAAQTNPYAKLSNPEYEGLKTLTEEVNDISNGGKPQNTPIKLFPKTKLPCISFQFDDNPLNDEIIVNLFEEYHKTCAFAFIASPSNINGSGKRYVNYQKRGFQIMNHSVSGTNLTLENYTYATALEAVFTARQRIENEGMICNGFVCPSSTIEETFKPILALAHNYAFTTSTSYTTGNNRNSDRCDLHRHSMQGTQTLQDLKDFIDGCITNDQIITLYGHAGDLLVDGTVDEFSSARIRALIEYCIAKEQTGELFFAGTDECVKYYFDL